MKIFSLISSALTVVLGLFMAIVACGTFYDEPEDIVFLASFYVAMFIAVIVITIGVSVVISLLHKKDKEKDDAKDKD